MRKLDAFESLALLIVGGYLAYAWWTGQPQDVVLAHVAAGFATLVLFWGLNFVDGTSAGRGAILVTAAIVLALGFESGSLFIALTYGALGIGGLIAQKLGWQGERLPVMPFAVVVLAGMGVVAALG